MVDAIDDRIGITMNQVENFQNEPPGPFVHHGLVRIARTKCGSVHAAHLNEVPEDDFSVTAGFENGLVGLFKADQIVDVSDDHV